MNYRSKRFIFESAAPEDGKGLLEILEEASFKGKISLLYTRRPDAYRSLKKEGKQVDIVVCRDTERGKIVGFGACAVRKLFVNGKVATVGYLFGLRVRQEYSGKYPLLHRGYEFLHALHKEKAIPLYITTILEDNLSAQKVLEKRRSFMPTYLSYGSYEVYALKVSHAQPLKSRTLRRGIGQTRCLRYTFRQAQQQDIPSLVKFLTESGRSSQFFPVIEEKDLQEGIISGITIEDFHLLCDENREILAAGMFWVQTSYKQYLVQGYSGALKLLYPFSRLFPLFRFPALPAPGSILNFFTLSFWVVKNNDPEIFTCFLDAISVVAGEYPFFLVGVHETHPLRKVLQTRPHIRYKSKLYLVSWDEQKEHVDKLDKDMVPYLECGML